MIDNKGVQFNLFIKKVIEEIENFEEYFEKLDKKIRPLIQKKEFFLQDLALIIYAYSKYQITEKSLWKTFYNYINMPEIQNLKLESISQILLAFTMIQSLSNQNPDIGQILDDQEYIDLYNKIFKVIESKISELSFLDTFRICISMTKRPLAITSVPESIWKALQLNFIKEIATFDLYQMSQILLLFCETPYLNYDVFTAVEEEVNEEYLQKIDEVIKSAQSGQAPFNIVGLLEDLSKIAFAFALSRQGSSFYWNNVLKTIIKLENNLSNLALENLLFVCYRLIDYLAHIQAMKGVEQPDESMKNLS